MSLGINLMKTTPEQAIYDFSNAIYKIAKTNFDQAKEPLDKSKFLFECLILLNELKMAAGQISSYNQTIVYLIDNEKYTLWLVEAPDPSDKFIFLDYLSREITAIFYNLNPDACNR